MKTPQKKLNSKKNEKLKKFIVSLNASKLPPNNFKSPTHCKKNKGRRRGARGGKYQYGQESNKALNNNETQRNSETRGRKVPRRAREQQSTMQQQCMKEE
jgi:hypothetical protein